MGRVVDPLALDGAEEPMVELTGESASGAETASPGLEPGEITGDSPDDAEQPRGATSGASHPVRDRLLAKARLAENLRGLTSDPAHEASEPPLWPSPIDELEHIAPRRPPSAPVRARRDRLSANLTALFGGLFGLSMFAAVFAVLIHVDPRDEALPPLPVGEVEKSATPAETPRAEAALSSEPAPAAPAAKRKRGPRERGPWRIADEKGKGDRIVEGTVGREPFLRAVQDAGVPKKEAYRVLIAFKGVRDFDKCGSHDQFVAELDRSTKRLLAFEYIVSKEEVYQARTGDDGLLKGQRLDLKVERTRVQGAIVMTNDSFSQAAEAGGFEPGLGDLIDEALDGHGSVDQFKKGDRLRVVAQEVTVLGEFSRYAALEALEYLARGKEQPLRIYYFKGANARGYYDARGRAPFEGGWRKPIKGAPVTSKFNPKRRHPILNKIMPHTGTDFGAPMGTPVGASSPGTISYMGYAGASGNLVKIDHAGGYETGYAHLSRFESGLKVGDHVDRMQIVGYVGSTGRSTGPHLHFTAKKDGKYIDAESLQLDALRVLPKSERTEFSLQRAKYDKLIEAIVLPPPLGGTGQTEAEVAPSAEDDGADEESSTTASSSAEEETEESTPSEADEAEQAAEPVAERVPARAVPATAPSPAPTPRPASGSLYLTDRDLMKSQSVSDDGEVAE